MKLFIFVITSGLQPARDLLFRLFQQPVQACIPSCKKGEALAEVATQSLLPASGSAFPTSSATCEVAPLKSFLSTAANRCIPRSWPFPFGVNVYRLVTPLPPPWVPQNLENTRLGIRNRCKIFLRKGLEVKILKTQHLAGTLWVHPRRRRCI